MKNIYALAILVLSSFALFAGQSELSVFVRLNGLTPEVVRVGKNYVKTFDSQAAYKTDALSKRVIGYRSNDYNGVSLVLEDSITMSYSGSRGNSSLMNEDFDEFMKYINLGGLPEKSERHTNTWNSDGTKSKRVSQFFNAGAWENERQQVYTYNAQKRMATDISQIWVSGAWTNQTLLEYTYSAAGYVTEVIASNWNGSTWDKTTRYAYTYNSLGAITFYLMENWVASAWVANYSSEYYYNTDNLLIEVLNQMNSGMGLANYNRVLYTYFADGSVETETQQYWDSGAWQNQVRKAYEYDVNGNEIVMTRYTPSMGWEPNEKTTKTYNSSDKLIEETFHTWNISVWDYEWKKTSAYDAYGYANYLLKQNYSGGNWVNEYRFDLINLQTGEISFLSRLDWAGMGWEPNREEFYYYEDYAPTAISDLQSLNLSVYPNPASSELNIQFECETSREYSLRITDLLGREVLSERIKTDNAIEQRRLNVSELNSGLYLLKIEQSDESGVIKFYKQ